MNLFDSPEIMEQAKETLKKTIELNVGKYLIHQDNMVRILSQGEPLKHSEKSGKKHKKECEFCKFSELLAEMSKVREVAAEATVQYKYICDEEIDLDAIFEELSDKLEKKKNSIMEFEGIVPENAPQEVKDLISTLKSALQKNGMDRDISMEVIDLKANNFGLNPEDFPDFAQYAKAVSQARAKFRAENKDKPGEDVITEAIIQNIEKGAVDKNPNEKLN